MPKRVQVVLNEDILSLGKDGDLVEVAPGYARNFLLPFGKAVPLTPAVMKQVEHRRAKEAERQAALKQEAIDFKTALEGSLEVDGFLLQGCLTLSFLGPAVLHLLHHRRGEGDSFTKGQQEVAGVTGSHFDQVSVLAQAEDVLIQNDLYTLRHGTGTKDGGGCDGPRYDVACC